MKIPMYNIVSGDESGMAGDIILDTSINSFCFHNGLQWNCINGPISGTVGPTGPVIIGNTGPTGMHGNLGPVGPTGPIGSMGSLGARGSTGLAGSAGQIGDTGPAGADGSMVGLNSPWTVSDPNFIQNTMYTGDPVDFGANNLLFGSQQIDSTINSTRMFFISDTDTMGLGSFRAGTATGNQWDTINRGDNSVAFGTNNVAFNDNTFIGGGIDNTTSAINAAIMSGGNNYIKSQASNSFIGSGSNNIIALLENSSIASGTNNSISGKNSFIGAGDNNTCFGNYSSIGAGTNNMNDRSQYCFIGSGTSNTISSSSTTAIVCGTSNTISDVNNSCIVAGTNLFLDQDSTIMTQNIRINNSIQLQQNKFIGSDTTLTIDDYILNSITNVGEIDVTMPENPVHGQTFYLYTFPGVNANTNTISFVVPPGTELVCEYMLNGAPIRIPLEVVSGINQLSRRWALSFVFIDMTPPTWLVSSESFFR